MESETPFIEQDQNRERKGKSSFVDFLQSIVIALVVCVVVYIFLATPNQIEGQSMEPNFHQGEIVLTSKVNQWLGGTDLGKSLDLDYKRGDIVVFQKPGMNDFIKRVVGLPGDTVSIKDGYLYINGEQLNEAYLPGSTYTKGGSFIIDDDTEKVIPDGYYFAVGDNRSNSHDSRYIDIGFVKRDWMKGKVILRYWPLNKFMVIQEVEY